MCVIGIRDRSGRRSWIDRLLGTIVHPLHSRVAAIGQSVHHLTTTDAARSTRGTVACCSAMGAEVTAVVQATLLPADWTRSATSAAPSIAVASAISSKLAQYPAAATGVARVALLAAVVTACVAVQAPGSAGHNHRN